MDEGLNGSSCDESHDIALCWLGPFSLLRDSEDSLFLSGHARSRGVYLLTMDAGDGFRVYSCGLTNSSFGERFRKHLREYRNGVYHIFDTEEFRKGVRKPLWRGFWYKKRKHDHLEEYNRRREEISQYAENMISELRIFLAPLDQSRRVLERIEAKIMEMMYTNPDPSISELPDRGMALRPRSRDFEEKIQVVNSVSHLIYGLPRSFDV